MKIKLSIGLFLMIGIVTGISEYVGKQNASLFQSVEAVANGTNDGELPTGWLVGKKMGEVRFQVGENKTYGWSFSAGVSIVAGAPVPTVTFGGSWDGSKGYDIIRCCQDSEYKGDACNPAGNYKECSYCKL